MDESAAQHQAVENSLLGIPFFRSLSREALSAISAKLKKVHFEQGEIVVVENSLGDALYLIESGQVKVSVNAETGQEKVINYLGPGNFLARWRFF